MSVSRRCLRAVRHIIFGDTLLPQEFTVGLEDPNAEIAIWLHTLDARYEVTGRLTIACTAPLTLCIAFHDKQKLSESSLDRPVLKFCVPYGQGQLLGEVYLCVQTTISIGASQFILFGVTGSTNYCLPRFQLAAHCLLQAYSRWRRNDPSDIKMTLVEERAAAVTFIRPHPLCLVSVRDRSSGNIFTMNLMGDLEEGYFGFALRDCRVVADLVERSGRIAISSIPLAKCALAFQFAANYKKESIDWAELPFETIPSASFGIPVPDWAISVRELEVVKVHRIGSHRLFIARIIHDEVHTGGLHACVVHGFYQYWRTKSDRAKLRASIKEDSVRKLKR